MIGADANDGIDRADGVLREEGVDRSIDQGSFLSDDLDAEAVDTLGQKSDELSPERHRVTYCSHVVDGGTPSLASCSST